MNAVTAYPSFKTKEGKELIPVPLEIRRGNIPDYYLVYAENDNAVLIALIATLREAWDQLDDLHESSPHAEFRIYHLISARDGKPAPLMGDIVHEYSGLPDTFVWTRIALPWEIRAFLERNDGDGFLLGKFETQEEAIQVTRDVEGILHLET